MTDSIKNARSALPPNRCLAGKWDDKGARMKPPFPCRYFFSWTEMGNSRIAGYFGGYLGGGAFIDASFRATFKRKALVEFVWLGRDHVSGEERPQEWPEAIRMQCDEHLGVFLAWHDENAWEDGVLHLAPGLENRPGLTLAPDDIFYMEPESRESEVMQKVAAMVGYTGILCTFGISDDD